MLFSTINLGRGWAGVTSKGLPELARYPQEEFLTGVHVKRKVLSAGIFAALSLSLVTLGGVNAIGHQEWLNLVYNIAFLVGSIIIAVSIAKGEEDV